MPTLTLRNGSTIAFSTLRATWTGPGVRYSPRPVRASSLRRRPRFPLGDAQCPTAAAVLKSVCIHKEQGPAWLKLRDDDPIYELARDIAKHLTRLIRYRICIRLFGSSGRALFVYVGKKKPWVKMERELLAYGYPAYKIAALIEEYALGG